MKEEQVEKLAAEFNNRSTEENLAYVNSHYANEAVFSTSFGMEDQAIVHMIASLNAKGISVFTLDTGRIFTETYSVWTRTLEKYKMPISAYAPDQSAVQEFITQYGPNAFYESVELRKSCCAIRKVAPLKKALAGKKVWITGIRAEQSPDRSNMKRLEWDEAHQILKYHPLLSWTWDELSIYIQKNNVPVNSLHQKGFLSIGCSPCTRALKPGEDFRAGRWWWENQETKECGLHTHE